MKNLTDEEVKEAKERGCSCEEIEALDSGKPFFDHPGSSSASGLVAMVALGSKWKHFLSGARKMNRP